MNVFPRIYSLRLPSVFVLHPPREAKKANYVMFWDRTSQLSQIDYWGINTISGPILNIYQVHQQNFPHDIISGSFPHIKPFPFRILIFMGQQGLYLGKLLPSKPGKGTQHERRSFFFLFLLLFLSVPSYMYNYVCPFGKVSFSRKVSSRTPEEMFPAYVFLLENKHPHAHRSRFARKMEGVGSVGNLMSLVWEFDI